jgi:UTP--glucose-1-phosphate uridylyltransferase
MGIRSVSGKSIGYSYLANRKKIVKAVIPAAGFGTRMLPATKAVPKEMLPVAGKPLIQFTVEEAVASGIETIILVVGSHKSVLQGHFGRNLELESFLEVRQQSAAADLVRRIADVAEIIYVEQEEPRGLAHAISCARPLLGEEAFAVLLPDVIMLDEVPVTRQLLCAREQHGGSVVAIREVEFRDVERHGIIRVDSDVVPPSAGSVRIAALVEKPSAAHAPSRLGVFGRYVLEPVVWDFIAQAPPDLRGEMQLTDALHLLCHESPLFGHFFEGSHYDAGDPLGYLTANVEIALQDPRLRQPLLDYLSHLRALPENSTSCPPSTLFGSSVLR